VQIYLPGGLGTDTGGATSTITPYDAASRTGSTINLVWFENNSAVSTGGLFLTSGRAGMLGTVNVDAILAAAINYSSETSVAIYIPAGTYVLSTTQTLGTGTTLIGAPGFQTIFAKAFGMNGMNTLFNITGDHVFLQDLMVQGYKASYVNLWTNQFLPTPNLFDWQTVTVGNLNGAAPIIADGGWQLSKASATNSALVPQMHGAALYFDSYPPGLGSSPSLTLIQATLMNAYVLWNYCLNQYVQVTSVTIEMIGSWTGYVVGIAGPKGTLYRDGFTPTVDGTEVLGPIAQTISNPDYIGQKPFPPAYIQFFAAPPTYYEGDFFTISGDFPTFRNVAGVGIVNGKTYGGESSNPRFYNTHCLATFGTGGEAGFRFTGLGAIFDGCVSNSGDDGAQQSQQPKYNPYYLNALNSPTYGFTASTFAERWIGCDITTIGTGRACAIAVNSGANGTSLTGTSNGASAPSNSMTFLASNLPSGLTLTTLGQSAAPWVGMYEYDSTHEIATGYLVVNANNLYSLTGTGTSGTAGGPSSIGTGTITDGGCTWLHVSQGSTIFIYDDTLSSTAAGAYVTGYMSASGTVVVSAAAPDGDGGTDMSPFSATPVNTKFVFLIANGNSARPPMILNNTVDIQFERCTLRSLVAEIVVVQNNDSFATFRAAFHGCTFDGSWSTTGTQAMMNVNGNPIVGGGGNRITVDQCRFYAPANACFNATGLNSYINISRSELYPPSTSVGTIANVTLGGASQIDFVENTVWAAQSVAGSSYTAGVVTLGNAPTTYFGLVQPQSAGNARIIGNRFLGLYAGAAYATPALNIDYASGVLVSNNVFAAGTNAPPYAAMGVALTSNAANVISSANIFSTVPIAYTGTLAQLSINGSEIYDTGSPEYVPPPIPSYPGIAPQVVSWTPTLGCDTNSGSLVFTSLTQTGTVLRTLLSNGNYKNDVEFTISGSLTVGAGSGYLRIQGLPYLNSSSNAQCLSVGPPISAFTWVDPTGVPVWTIQAGHAYMYLGYMKSGSMQFQESIGSLTSVSPTFSLSGFGSYISTS
jgi:hypothetical protein